MIPRIARGAIQDSLPGARARRMLTCVSLFERDLVRRLIKQLGEIAAKLAGLSAQRKFDEAEALVRRTEQDLFGPLTATLDAVDIRTVALLLGSDDKIGACAVLWLERAKLLHARGKAEAGRAVAARTVELLGVLETRTGLTTEVLKAASTSARELAGAQPRTG
jgi:hypothetical protein